MIKLKDSYIRSAAAGKRDRSDFKWEPHFEDGEVGLVWVIRKGMAME